MKMTGATLRVLLADDHPVVLNGLEALIRADRLFETIATCTEGSLALQTIIEEQPDLAILDVSMPGLTGVEILERIAAQGLRTRVILLTGSASDQQIVEAVARGAYGLMLKDAASDTLLECMRSVAMGRRWLPSDLVNAAALREEERRAKANSLENVLTVRERTIVTLVAEGQSNKEIARHLGVTEGTIKIHLYNIYPKLQVGNRTALATWAHNNRDQLLEPR